MSIVWNKSLGGYVANLLIDNGDYVVKYKDGKQE